MDDLPFPLKLAEVCLHLSYSDEEMSGDISVALSQAHKELTAQHNAIEALQARVAKMDWERPTLEQLADARRDALEEAAKVAYECGSEPISEAIRALAEKG